MNASTGAYTDCFKLAYPVCARCPRDQVAEAYRAPET